MCRRSRLDFSPKLLLAIGTLPWRNMTDLVAWLLDCLTIKNYSWITKCLHSDCHGKELQLISPNRGVLHPRWHLVHPWLVEQEVLAFRGTTVNQAYWCCICCSVCNLPLNKHIINITWTVKYMQSSKKSLKPWSLFSMSLFLAVLTWWFFSKHCADFSKHSIDDGHFVKKHVKRQLATESVGQLAACFVGDCEPPDTRFKGC